MPKQYLRFLDLGQNTFWHIIEEAVDATETDLSQWQKELQSAKIHLWLASKDNAQCSTLEQSLQKLGLAYETFYYQQGESCSQPANTQNQQVINITCGFSESDLYVFMQDVSAQSSQAWFNALGEHMALWPAMAEVAFLFDHCQKLSKPIDSYRICWLGKVTPLAQSLISACIYAPFELFMGIPSWSDPEHASTDLALKGGAKVFMTREPRLALDEAHIIYMDTELELIAQRAKEKSSKVKQFTPIISSNDDFVWQNGLQLDEKHLAYALPQVEVVSTDPFVSYDKAQSELQDIRKSYYERMLLACLRASLKAD